MRHPLSMNSAQELAVLMVLKSWSGDVRKMAPGFSGSSAGKEFVCIAGDPGLIPGKICWRRDRLPNPVFLGFPCSSAGEESTCNAGDLGVIPGLGRFPREGNSYPLQYSGLENSMDCIVHGVPKSWTWLTFTSLTSS